MFVAFSVNADDETEESVTHRHSEDGGWVLGVADNPDDDPTAPDC
jgi:hypothetical protein